MNLATIGAWAKYKMEIMNVKLLLLAIGLSVGVPGCGYDDSDNAADPKSGDTSTLEVQNPSGAPPTMEPKGPPPPAKINPGFKQQE